MFGSGGRGVRRLLWIPALLGAGLLYAALDDAAGLQTWLRLDAELRAKRTRIDALRDELVALRHQKETLTDDPIAIERAIREDLEWARPGEVVVRLPAVGPPNARIP